jgi:hypothetical protein
MSHRPRHSLLRSLILTAAISLSPLAGVGCQSISPGGSTTQPTDVNAVITAHGNEIRIGAELATAAVLMSVSDADRDEIGRYAYQIADAIQQAVQGDHLDLSGVRQFAVELIIKSNSHRRDQLNSLLLALTDLIDVEVSKLNLPAGDLRLQAVQTLLVNACQGVKNATITYRATPTTQPGL